MDMSLNKEECRLQFRFWLDKFRPEEKELAAYVTELKKKRRFAQTIRDALRLIQDLRQGRVEVLLSLFPWIEDYFTKPTTQPVVVSLPEPFQDYLARLEQLLSQQQLQIPDEKPKLAQTTKLLLNERNIEDSIEIKRDENTKAGWNALISMAALNGRFSDLPPEIIEYGIQLGRIPASQKKKPTNPPSPSGGPKPMDVPQFAPPSFDDDEESIEIAEV